MSDLSETARQFQRLRLVSIKWHLRELSEAVERLEAELQCTDEGHERRIAQRCDDVRSSLEIEWLKDYVSDIERPLDILAPGEPQEKEAPAVLRRAHL